MKPGFLQAVAAARDGQAPVPGRMESPEQAGMTQLHEQLLASVRAQEEPVRTSTYSPEGQPSTGPRRLNPPPRPSPPRQGGPAGGKGTIEEVLGERVAVEPDAVVQYPVHHETQAHPAPDRRGQDTEGDWTDDPPVSARQQMQRSLHRVVQAVVDDAVEQALAREQDQPLEEDPGVEATQGVSSAQSRITYDLPVDLSTLPAFCYVAGPAGTGKTFQAKAWAAHNPEGVVLAATTGIAAVNLGEGTTINALLRFYDTGSLRDAFTGGWLEAQCKKLRGAGLQRVVLDEVSMLDGDQLTILCRALDNVNQDRGEGDAELGLVLVGDFAQLPPVKAPFAFESAEWDRFAQATYRLTTIRRQADRDFVEALQAVRRGDGGKALEFFGPRLEQTTHQTFEGTTILAKNEAVDKYNQLRLDKVLGRPVQFPSSRWGKLRSEWGGAPKPKAEWGVPEVLQLKIGALVMVLANRNIAERGEAPEYLYVNGDLGQVVDARPTSATVVLQRTGEPVDVQMIERTNVIPLEVGRRKALKAEGHPERISEDGKHEILGAVTYLPLRLAYASTVHKSQGLSLDQVQVNIRDHFFSTPGMLYVALSRARTAEGLRVVGSPEAFRIRCSVSQKVVEWL